LKLSRHLRDPLQVNATRVLVPRLGLIIGAIYCAALVVPGPWLVPTQQEKPQNE
jgi:hypothetical protein